MNDVLPNKLLLANPRGFCAGVDRAIDIIDQLLELHGPPVYVRREIVHNREVVDGFRARGAVFVDEVEDVPEGALLVFSAHGISPAVRSSAQSRHLRVIDATCPLVAKVHIEALRFAREGLFLLLVGHRNHDEVAGTLGHVPGGIALVEDVAQAETVAVPDPERVALITQTTLSLDDAGEVIEALKRRFPRLREPARSDICYATQNRQTTVKRLARYADIVVVVGSDNSSNSQRLRECAESAGSRAYLVDDVSQIDPVWFEGKTTIGLTAGASSPEPLVQRILARLAAICGELSIKDFGEREPDITFAPPRELVALRDEERLAQLG
jgi:4-hydroxy-3-methylbut-2-enyl diphosphate reductase